MIIPKKTLIVGIQKARKAFGFYSWRCETQREYDDISVEELTAAPSASIRKLTVEGGHRTPSTTLRIICGPFG
jgi:hypothetical protein